MDELRAKQEEINKRDKDIKLLEAIIQTLGGKEWRLQMCEDLMIIRALVIFLSFLCGWSISVKYLWIIWLTLIRNMVYKILLYHFEVVEKYLVYKIWIKKIQIRFRWITIHKLVEPQCIPTLRINENWNDGKF